VIDWGGQVDWERESVCARACVCACVCACAFEWCINLRFMMMRVSGVKCLFNEKQLCSK
jgi:hypothetical protein